MRWILAALFFVFPVLASAATSQWVVTDQYSARLIVAEQNVTPNTSRLSAGLEVNLAEGWKTYWEFPGEVGLPPELIWDGSTNLKSTRLLYPTPTRFTAFDIENYGYGDRVVFPIEIELNEAGQGTDLILFANLLVCADICIPASVDLALSVTPGTDGPNIETASILAKAMSSVPDVSSNILTARWGDGFFDVQIPQAPGVIDAFPHDPTGLRFGKPELLPAQSGGYVLRFATTTEGETAPTAITTVVDGQALTSELEFTAASMITETGRGLSDWLMAALFALIGGLILNVMPCVLPVLSIKFAGVVAARDKPLRDIRAGFLATAAGILTFALGLALVVILLRMLGISFGLGVQFQSPIFLTAMIGILLFFAGNLFGWFEFQLPQNWSTRLDNAGRNEGLIGDYLTGLFAALLATPCSAPFLGAAITFAFTGSAFDALSVFAFLGLGLALPYLAAAAFPQFVKALPKPGAWMVWIKYLLAVGVAGTAIWLTFVLSATIGIPAAALVLALGSLGVAIWSFGQHPVITTSGIAMVAAAIILP
ncbi:MAG: protein-disulfide reductase DsbD domain-containing protein, partial [Pseudomonadota bacterium]